MAVYTWNKKLINPHKSSIIIATHCFFEMWLIQYNYIDNYTRMTFWLQCMGMVYTESYRTSKVFADVFHGCVGVTVADVEASG